MHLGIVKENNKFVHVQLVNGLRPGGVPRFTHVRGLENNPKWELLDALFLESLGVIGLNAGIITANRCVY